MRPCHKFLSGRTCNSEYDSILTFATYSKQKKREKIYSKLLLATQDGLDPLSPITALKFPPKNGSCEVSMAKWVETVWCHRSAVRHPP